MDRCIRALIVCVCCSFLCCPASYNAFNALTTAFEKLSETLRDLKGVPLKIASVRASDAGAASSTSYAVVFVVSCC